MNNNIRDMIKREHSYGESWKSIQISIRYIYRTFVSKADILKVIEGNNNNTRHRYTDVEWEQW